MRTIGDDIGVCPFKIIGLPVYKIYEKENPNNRNVV